MISGHFFKTVLGFILVILLGVISLLIVNELDVNAGSSGASQVLTGSK